MTMADTLPKHETIHPDGPAPCLPVCPPDIITDGQARLIPLTQGKFALVDDEDYERLNQFKWYAGKYKYRYYAARTHKLKTITMAREIMDAPKGLQVDHRNHNTLDNRRKNLRLCTNSQNQHNRAPNKKNPDSSVPFSKHKGVSWSSTAKKWVVHIRHNSKKTYLGRYADEKEAARVYDVKARELFGDFACLNLSN